MADIKITSEVLEVLKKDRMTLINDIQNGKVKGKIIPPSTILIDSSELPENYQQKSIEGIPENINKPLKTELDLPPKIDTNSKEYLLAQAEVFKAETQKIEAEIKLFTAKGERDRPQVLAQKEQSVIALKAQLETREKEIVVKENNLNIREQVIKNKEIELDQKFSTADAEIQKKRDLADSLNLQISQEDDRLTNEITRKRLELDNLKITIEQVKKEATPIVDWLNSWIRWTQNQATKYYQNKDYDTSNNLFGKSSTLQKLRQKLGF